MRYAILDHATDDAALWELAWSLSQFINGRDVVIHPRRPVSEVLLHLLDLLREGHVEIYLDENPQEPSLPLEEALAVAADDANWDPASAKASYRVVATKSGDDEYENEYAAARQGW
jgi:hypothetical protein